MAAAKSNQEIKRERKRAKRESVDRLTNGYMINLAWGILGIVVLRFVESGYSSADTVLIMPYVMKTLAAVFAAAAVCLFILGGTGVIKNSRRARNYGIFAVALTVVSAWIGFFQQIRLAAIKLFPQLYSLDSRWWISWGPITLLVIYLILALIWTCIRAAAIEKGKVSGK